ncbi:hypothetical protein MNBD_PLANCTO02-1887 [hydrothermal vent metagenome]|uniref:Protein SirB1 N-terminal domain-containing protein n=1 Tax=hydrothermal vent metagenome TaxID=652676 RepID=A0A3B1E3Q2_9ZZZZ
MSISEQFQCDSEFIKLLMRRDDIDLATASLEIARDAYPHLDFDETFDWIDDRAEELAGPVARAKTDVDVLEELQKCLVTNHQIHGSRDAFCQADGSFLNRVIETKQGIPISLSLLYMTVADRLGIKLSGVAAPIHFITRYESVAGPLFLDPFSGGRVMTFVEAADWLQQLTGAPGSSIINALKPAEPRAIIIRMLNNLKRLYVEQKCWKSAWNVQHRLAALQPTLYEERRDLAVLSLKAHRPGYAINLLNCCLKSCPPDESEMLVQHLESAQTELSRWN